MMIKIIPLDTLFFRTGRPFTMGEDTWAEVLFPPYPSTLYGAIRSFLIFQREGLKAFQDGKYKLDIGTTEEKGSLKIKGPLISKDDELLFPAPLDLVLLEDKLVPLAFTEKPSNFVAYYPLIHLLLYKSKAQAKEPKGWLNDIELKDYLRNKYAEYTFIEDDDLFLPEPKIGIAREKSSLTTKEGHLCRISMIRVKKGCSLVLDIEGVDDIPACGVIQLGGESKGAKFEKIEDRFERLGNIDIDIKNRLFKIYIATPAIFKKGWLPEWISEETLEGTYNGIKLKLVCCALGKYLSIGGWDIAKKRAKPLQRGVPAGSVYYFEILDGSDGERIKSSFHLKNISDINPEEGFGLSLLGEVKI